LVNRSRPVITSASTAPTTTTLEAALDHLQLSDFRSYESVDLEGERQRQVAPRRNPMQWYQHEANETRLARVQDHNDLLKMMRLHFEAPRAVDGELTLRRRNRLHLARPTNMSMDLIIGVTRCVQDHLLTNRHVDLLPTRSGLPIRDRDVDGQRVVTSSR
jgi:hypothetical protein